MISAHFSLEEFRRRLVPIRMLSLDVDGVQTDGGLYYGSTGDEQRRFYVRDGTGIQRVLSLGVVVVFATSSAVPAIRLRAERLGVKHVLSGIEDKVEALTTLGRQLGISLDAVAHVADDINDLPLLRLVGCPVAVADAVPEVRSTACYITANSGGRGAVREVCDLLHSVRVEATSRGR